MVKIKLVCSVCKTNFYYDIVDLLMPKVCCDMPLTLATRLDEIDFEAELPAGFGLLGNELIDAIILDKQKVLCDLCGERSLFYTTIPYESLYDGYTVCGECVRKHFDPTIHSLENGENGTKI